MQRIQLAFDNRPSRQDDTERIQQLEAGLAARDDYMQKQDLELRQARMELANREQNYNSTFAASGLSVAYLQSCKELARTSVSHRSFLTGGVHATVGVLDPLAKRQNGLSRALPIAGQGSLQGPCSSTVTRTNQQRVGNVLSATLPGVIASSRNPCQTDPGLLETYKKCTPYRKSEANPKTRFFVVILLSIRQMRT